MTINFSLKKGEGFGEPSQIYSVHHHQKYQELPAIAPKALEISYHNTHIYVKLVTLS